MLVMLIFFNRGRPGFQSRPGQGVVPLKRAARKKKCEIHLQAWLNLYIYLSHDNSNSIILGFLTSGASDFISNRAHFSFETSTGHITLDISVIYEIHFQDRYKGPSCNIHINPRSVNPNILFVYILKTQTINVQTLLFFIPLVQLLNLK